jgi:hypothetical protein
MNTIDYDFYHWGPFLWHTAIPLDLCDEMHERFKVSNIDHRANVASVIDNVKTIKDINDRRWFAETIQPYVKCYLDLQNEYHAKNLAEFVVLDELWINYQKAFEINPEHVHSGDLSFVLYLNIPDGIYEENKNFLGKSAGPGSISFRYGEFNNWAVHLKCFLPKKGDIFIFPAQLAHTVYPFKSEGHRISVSGNFTYEQIS